MEPLLVTAHLRNGFASSDIWSPSLDGILAYWSLREQLGEEEFALGMSDPARLRTPADLPLLRCDDGDGGQGQWWWWACSSPIYDAAAECLRYYHRRFDISSAMEHVRPLRARVETKAGPYKAYRLTQPLHITRQVQWHAVGDAPEIRRLLARCDWIGAKGSHGYGRVDCWSIEPGGDEGLARYHRPLPVAYAEACGQTGAVLFWGLRPPGRLPENKTLCMLPVREEDADALGL